MLDLTGVPLHPAIEEIVDVLCRKTENTDRGFFRVEVAYFLSKMAANMRAVIATKDRGEIPVNLYALALATSGYGKGHSVHIVENDFMGQFQTRFMEETFPLVAEDSLWDIANNRAIRAQTEPQAEYDKIHGDYVRAGAYPFTFDSGTSPAVKQLRTKLLLARCGSINLQIDEIGSNLVSNVEVLNLFLELFDQGIVKQKLTKNTSDSVRAEEISGKTPTNMLLFGTPTKLLDGGQTEDQFYSFLETGYARRCLFAWGEHSTKAFHTKTAEEVYREHIQPKNKVSVNKWADHFFKLADPAKYGWKMDVPDDVGIAIVQYRFECEAQAEKMADHEEIRKAEISHRFYKATKLAGALAFIDESSVITMTHFKQAVLVVEESGKAFTRLLTREKAYMKLAKYIATVGSPVTHTDLQEALPFYKSGVGYRNEMITMATAWGYKQHILIKKAFVDGIEFFRGETLEATKLDELVVSYSQHWAFHYGADIAPWDQLSALLTAEDPEHPGQPMHWSNHHYTNNHRARENLIQGFNMIVIDIDNGVTLAQVNELLKEYEFMTCTTKRHQTEGYGDRFRLVLPINYKLCLDSDDYKEFMQNIFAWLPFGTAADEASLQPEKKWETNPNGKVHYNKGTVLDVLPFIPRTRKNEEYQAKNAELQSLDNLERWFAQRIAMGNRNNQMIKFALALVDAGQSLSEVQKNVISFNKKLSNGLTQEELESTIFVTVAKRYLPK